MERLEASWTLPPDQYAKWLIGNYSLHRDVFIFTIHHRLLRERVGIPVNLSLADLPTRVLVRLFLCETIDELVKKLIDLIRIRNTIL